MRIYLCKNVFDHPCIAVSVGNMSIHDPFSSECGRFAVADPEAEYGIPDDLARAMGIINMYLKNGTLTLDDPAPTSQDVKLDESDLELADMIAFEFGRLLRNELLQEEFVEVLARNAAETDAGICHSHDFTDANMIMDQAFTNIGLRSTIDYDEDDTRGRDWATAMWNAAWDKAKAQGFKIDDALQDLDNRRYVCSWTTGDFASPGCQMVEADFFTWRNGYTPADIMLIRALEIRDVWDAGDYGRSHIVHRIK